MAFIKNELIPTTETSRRKFIANTIKTAGSLALLSSPLVNLASDGELCLVLI